MLDQRTSRRSLLLGTVAWGTGLAGLLAASRQSRAFQFEEVSPSSDAGLALANHCGPASEHAGIIANLQSRLANDPSVSSLTATCPLCGCPITVMR
jgi:hypothetical protein